MTDLVSGVLTAVFVAAFLLCFVCCVAGMVQSARASAAQDRADAQPDLDEHEVREMTGDEARAILQRQQYQSGFAACADDMVAQAYADYDRYVRRQHLPGERHYSEGTT